MAENEFRRSVSTDTAPRGGLCEWCGKPAAFRLTAIGGPAHNDSGLFCRECGDTFGKTGAQASASVGTTSNNG